MSLTSIDWLRFRTQAEPADCVQALREVFGEYGSHVRALHNGRGQLGFEQSARLCVADMTIGHLQYGGDAMRGWVRVDISGSGCDWVTDWDGCESVLRGLHQFQPRRVDIALTTCDGSVSHDSVVQAHRSGFFVTSGKPPSMTKIEPENPYEGRTVYVGKRDQPKFLRAYEKGYEIARKHPGVEITHVDGVPIEDLYRVELELKAKTQDLPVDLISNRDQYFAGAYPYLQSLLDVEPVIFRQSRAAAPRRTLDSMLGVLRSQYGNTLFTALEAHKGDIGAVWEKIVGSKHNEDLLEKGVLLIDH